ncbi:hypothetical protein L9F63_009407, partial [Diploptera punctata]
FNMHSFEKAVSFQVDLSQVRYIITGHFQKNVVIAVPQSFRYAYMLYTTAVLSALKRWLVVLGTGRPKSFPTPSQVTFRLRYVLLMFIICNHFLLLQDNGTAWTNFASFIGLVISFNSLDGVMYGFHVASTSRLEEPVDQLCDSQHLLPEQSVLNHGRPLLWR